MYSLWLPQLSDTKGNARRRTAGIEEILPQGAQAHPAQGIQEEITPKSEIRNPKRKTGRSLSDSLRFEIAGFRISNFGFWI
jgi:hypothetical protein